MTYFSINLLVNDLLVNQSTCQSTYLSINLFSINLLVNQPNSSISLLVNQLSYQLTYCQSTYLSIRLLLNDLLFNQPPFQFKSVLEEDEDDLDEYDVGDEELAKLVAMTSADTDETDSDSDTETELPEERGAAVGADSLSEASSNTLNVSQLSSFILF